MAGSSEHRDCGAWNRSCLLLAVTGACLLLTGCASSPRQTAGNFWRNPWTIAQAAEPVSEPEPEVLANAAPAAGDDSSEPMGRVRLDAVEPAPAESAEKGSIFSAFLRRRSKDVHEPESSESSEENAAAAEVAEPQDDVQVTEDVGSRLDRLKAALNEDAQRADALPEETGGERRAEVMRLIGQARQELESGQLELARQTALAAQAIADEAHVGFSPDEERPIDLVSRIEDLLQIQAPQPPDALEELTGDAGVLDSRRTSAEPAPIPRTVPEAAVEEDATEAREAGSEWRSVPAAESADVTSAGSLPMALPERGEPTVVLASLAPESIAPSTQPAVVPSAGTVPEAPSRAAAIRLAEPSHEVWRNAALEEAELPGDGQPVADNVVPAEVLPNVAPAPAPPLEDDLHEPLTASAGPSEFEFLFDETQPSPAHAGRSMPTNLFVGGAVILAGLFCLRRWRGAQIRPGR